MAFVKSFDKTNILVKFILTLIAPIGIVIGGIYRILKGRLLWGILWLLTGGLLGIGWIIDLISVILNNKYTFLT